MKDPVGSLQHAAPAETSAVLRHIVLPASEKSLSMPAETTNDP